MTVKETNEDISLDELDEVSKSDIVDDLDDLDDFALEDQTVESVAKIPESTAYTEEELDSLGEISDIDNSSLDIKQPHFKFDSKELLDSLAPIATVLKESSAEEYRAIRMKLVQGGVEFRANTGEHKFIFEIKLLNANSGSKLIQEPKIVFIKNLINVAKTGKTLTLAETEEGDLEALVLGGTVPFDTSANIREDHFIDIDALNVELSVEDIESLNFLSNKADAGMSLTTQEVSKIVSVKDSIGFCNFSNNIYLTFKKSPNADIVLNKSDLGVLKRAYSKSDNIRVGVAKEGKSVWYVFESKSNDSRNRIYLTGRLDNGIESARSIITDYTPSLTFNISPLQMHSVFALLKAQSGDSCVVNLKIEDGILWAKAATLGKKPMKFKLATAGDVDKFTLNQGVSRLIAIMNLIKEASSATIIIDNKGFMRFNTEDLQITLAREV